MKIRLGEVPLGVASVYTGVDDPSRSDGIQCRKERVGVDRVVATPAALSVVSDERMMGYTGSTAIVTCP